MNITLALALLVPICLSSDSSKMQDAKNKKRTAMQVVDMADVRFDVCVRDIDQSLQCRRVDLLLGPQLDVF